MKIAWGSLALAMIASLCIYLLRLQGSPDSVWLGIETLAVVLFCVWFRWMMARTHREDRIPSAMGTKPNWVHWFSTSKRTTPILWIGTVIVVLPWLSRIVQTRFLGGTGEATELVWLAMLQYAALWQAAVSTTARQDWLSFLMSCFLVLFGLATSDRPGMIQIVLPFALLAAWWLMARYWDSIEGGFLASESVPLLRMRLMVLVLMLGLGGLVLAIAARSTRNITDLSGFMPTSGGDKRGESWARQGIGDGDMLVAAKDEAYTFGPVDSDLFMDSETPSMYDLVSEIYGDPVPRQRQYARAISLDNKTDESEQEGTESNKNSREFSAHRRPDGASGMQRPKGTDSRAVLYLVGTTPLHLRLESFDHFEDNTWSQTEGIDMSRRQGAPMLQSLHRKPWMSLQDFPNELIYPVRERIATKIIQFKSPRLLSPSQITHVHIDRVDQPDFFDWTKDGQLMMPNREYVPQLTVVHQLFQIPQLHALRSVGNPMQHLAHQSSAHALPSDWIRMYTQLLSKSDQLKQIAQDCIRKRGMSGTESASDWQRVEAIVRTLREEYVFDPAALPPENCEDVIEYMLQHKRGPDYLIATNAVALIRTLGIPCRLCRGFFASPNCYDPKSGQTEVLPEDLHTWAEVYAHGLWIPIEPTGTYPQPREHLTWLQWSAETAWALWDTIRQNPASALLIAIGFSFLVYLRQRVLELAVSLLFLITSVFPLTLRIRSTLQLLRWRMWLWGEGLAPRATMQDWLTSQLAIRGGTTTHDRSIFIQTVQRLAYAPRTDGIVAAGSELPSLRRVCRSVLWSGIYMPLVHRNPSAGQWHRPGNGFLHASIVPDQKF